MSTGKVLQISAEDAKYIDPTQIASLQMVDGTTIVVQGNQVEEGFVEEATDEQQQIQAQTAQDQQQNPQLRGRGLGALAGLAAGAAVLGTAAAIGGAMRRPRVGYGYGPMMGPMMGPRMMPPPPPRPMGMRGPMMGPRW